MPSILSTPNQSLSIDDLRSKADLIPDLARNRLHPDTVMLFDSLLSQRNIQDTLIDIHCHAFTYKHIPRDFVKYPKWIPESLVREFVKLKSKDFGKTLSIDSPVKIIEQLLTKYNEASHKSIKNVVLGLLTMDMERSIEGGQEEGFNDQLKGIVDIVKDHRFVSGPLDHVARRDLIPFIAIDPHNKDVLWKFLSSFGKGVETPEDLQLPESGVFQGLKIYPSLGYVPHHPLLMDLYAICERKQIPITSHCGGNRTHPSVEKIEVSYRKINDDGTEEDKIQSFIMKAEDGKRFTRYFNRPEHWQKILRRYPNLKLNLAHFGSNDDWENYRDFPTVKDRAKNSIQQTINLLLEFPNVYADFSYAFYTPKNIQAIFQTIQEKPQLKHKIMYGSDYYMCQIEKGEIGDFYKNVRKVFKQDSELCDHFFVKNAIKFLMS
jgi:hypothetical protein